MSVCTLIAAAVAHHLQEGKEEEDVHDGESWDDFITLRTREFNTVTRERPGDESVWLDFANFQVFNSHALKQHIAHCTHIPLNFC